MENLMLDDPALMVRTLGVAEDGMVVGGPSAAQLPTFFAEAFGLVQKIEDELRNDAKSAQKHSGGSSQAGWHKLLIRIKNHVQTSRCRHVFMDIMLVIYGVL